MQRHRIILVEDSNVDYPIRPVSDIPADYHQKLQWKIREWTWTGHKKIYLQLGTKIPGSFSTIKGTPPGLVEPHLGGFIRFDKDFIRFNTQWPKGFDHEKVHLSAVFRIKIDEGRSVEIKCDETKRIEGDKDCNTVLIGKAVKVTPDDIFEEDDVNDLNMFKKYFTLEAELRVTHSEISATGQDKDQIDKASKFKNDMETIFDDKKNSDIKVIAGVESYHCHKNILSARSEVFKNMLGPDTLETKTDTIEMKEVGTEAVKNMLKHVYSGEIPEDPEILTTDLLNIADMYLLDSLKEACLESLVQRLEVSSSISTFILVDRYLPNGGKLREMVIMFMKCNIKEVVELDDWGTMEDEHPSVVKDLMTSIAKSKLRSKEKHRHKCKFCVVTY